MPSRTLLDSQFLGTYYTVFAPKTYTNASYEYVDEVIDGWNGNYGYPDFPPGKNVGQPFYARHRKTDFFLSPSLKIRATNPYSNYRYEGRVLGYYPFSWATVGDYPPDPFGAEAYSRMKPTKPVFNGLNSLAELRDFPSLFQARLQHFKDLGGLYLNGQYGWLATLNDLKKFIHTQQRVQQRLEQLLRDNGRAVRRKITLRDDMVVTSETSGDLWGYHLPGDLVNYFYRAPPAHRTKVYDKDKIWASAQFRYFLPPAPKGVVYKDFLLKRLYGNQLTPSVIYNAFPWSWLVDWFASVGSLIENLEAGIADRCAAEYFYVMREFSRTQESERIFSFWGMNYEAIQVSGPSTQSAISRRRVKGSPFGIGIDFSHLNLMQLAILGALGLSKS